MFCPRCGTEIEGSTNFCIECGMAVKDMSNNYLKRGQAGSEMPQEERANVQVEIGEKENEGMGKTATSVVAYMTWIGFIVALCAGDKEGAKFYMNQAFVFHLFMFLCWVPFLGFLWSIFMLICFIIGVIWAAEQEERELPLIGSIRILK